MVNPGITIIFFKNRKENLCRRVDLLDLTLYQDIVCCSFTGLGDQNKAEDHTLLWGCGLKLGVGKRAN